MRVEGARGCLDVADDRKVQRPKALLDLFSHMATTAKHQIKGEARTFSDLHASCLILVYRALEPPDNEWLVYVAAPKVTLAS